LDERHVAAEEGVRAEDDAAGVDDHAARLGLELLLLADRAPHLAAHLDLHHDLDGDDRRSVLGEDLRQVDPSGRRLGAEREGSGDKGEGERRRPGERTGCPAGVAAASAAISAAISNHWALLAGPPASHSGSRYSRWVRSPRRTTTATRLGRAAASAVTA